MPQLDASTYLPQLFWLAVSFVTLYLLMARVALPGVAEVLESRRLRRDSDLERAEALREQALAARRAYEAALQQARAEAHRILAEANQAMTKDAQRRYEQLGAELAKETMAAEARIAESARVALAEVSRGAGDIVSAAVAKLTGATPAREVVERALGPVARERALGPGARGDLLEGAMFNEEFWVAVAFVLFFVAVGRRLWAEISKRLDARALRIRDELDEASRLRDEAQKLLSDYQRRQKEAAEEARGIVAHARDEAARMTGEAEARLAEQMSRRARSAKDKIIQAETRALVEVRAAVVDIAIAATGRAIRESLGAAQSKALIDTAVADLAKRLN